MSRLIDLCLLLAGVFYPFAVYFGFGHLAPWEFGLLLGGLWLVRALTSKGRPDTLWMAAIAIGFSVLLGVFDSPLLLRWYPALISAFLLCLFGTSLVFGPPMIERMARLSHPEMSDVALRYTRNVTYVWCLFFLGNGLTAAALTLWAPLSWWTLWTGVISYVLMGLLFAGEWLVRQRVRGRA
ncbi:MAG: hypothetical protein JWQ69_1310 [Pseudomonas sp.]|nr:hypothetical protein [Pseudomonas sp.]